MPALTLTTTSITAVLSSTLSTLSENGTSGSSLTTSNILIGILVELVILFLILGNLLMVVTLLLYKPWSITDLLLFSLSLADLINGTIPAHILNVMNNFYGQNLWSSSLCALFIWLTFSLRMTSVCTITLISAERSLMLTRPLRHHSIVTINKARVAVLVVWLFSAFIAALPFMGVGQSGYLNGYCFYQLYDLGIAFGCTIEVIGFIQLLLVLACFISIKLSSGKFIKRQSVMAAANQTGGNVKQGAKETSGTKQIKQLSKMMAIVVILYYVSWLPYLLTNLVSLILGHLPHIAEIIVGFLSLVNAIINPLLYGKMSMRYRRGYLYILKKMLSICGGEKPDGEFFDDKRKTSQAYSTYSQAMKRGSVAGNEAQQHINQAFEQEEQNRKHRDINSSSNNPAFKIDDNDNHINDDDDDNNIDDTGITIYPVEINKRHDNGDDEDCNDETQISICPLNESAHFDSFDKENINQERNEEDEGLQAKPTTVDEEDFSICPYDESIVVHFDELKKLAEEDNEDERKWNKDFQKSNTNLDNTSNNSTNDGKLKKDLDVSIPGAVLDSDTQHVDAINEVNDSDSVASSPNAENVDFLSDPNNNKVLHKQELESGNDSSSVEEEDSKEDSDGSDSYGEGSILGNYSIADNWTKNKGKSDSEEEENSSDSSSEESTDGSIMGNYDVAGTWSKYQQNSDSEEEANGNEEEKSSDSSSKGSVDGNFDIIDLLEKQNKRAEPVSGMGHFYVDDVVKKMEEEKERKRSMESFDLLSENPDFATNEQHLAGEEINPMDDVMSKKIEKNEGTVTEKANEKESTNEEVVQNEYQKKKNQEDEKEKENDSHKEVNESILGDKYLEDKDQKFENVLESGKHDYDFGAQQMDDKHDKNVKSDGEQEKDNEDDVEFRVHASIFKSSKPDKPGKRKVNRTVSDLLRRELGEI